MVREISKGCHGGISRGFFFLGGVNGFQCVFQWFSYVFQWFSCDFFSFPSFSVGLSKAS